jgi:hypothetical protein
MKKDSNHYDAVIADLEAKRNRLNGIIEALKELKELGVPMGAISAVGAMPHVSITTVEIPHDAFYGMKIPDAARKYLSWGGSRETKSHPELCDALLEGGFQTKSDNFREVVRSTLGRHPDFVKIKRQWGLQAWYGNRRAKVQSEPSNASDESESESSSS